jgi:hypothetical protein
VRRTISLVACFGLLLATAVPAGAAVEGGPPCADIDSLLWTYDGTDQGTPQTDDDVNLAEDFGIRLKAPSCERYTYTLHVYADAAQTSLIHTFSWVGDGTTQTFADSTLNISDSQDPDGEVWIYGESSFVTGGGKRIVQDRAPDVGLQVVQEDGPSGGTTVKAG